MNGNSRCHSRKRTRLETEWLGIDNKTIIIISVLFWQHCRQKATYYIEKSNQIQNKTVSTRGSTYSSGGSDPVVLYSAKQNQQQPKCWMGGYMAITDSCWLYVVFHHLLSPPQGELQPSKAQRVSPLLDSQKQSFIYLFAPVFQLLRTYSSSPPIQPPGCRALVYKAHKTLDRASMQQLYGTARTAFSIY